MNYKWTNLNSLLRKKKFRLSLNASLNHLNRSVKQRKISRRLRYIYRHVTVDLKLIVRSYKDHIGNLELYKLLKLNTIEISWKENTEKKLRYFSLPELNETWATFLVARKISQLMTNFKVAIFRTYARTVLVACGSGIKQSNEANFWGEVLQSLSQGGCRILIGYQSSLTNI